MCVGGGGGLVDQEVKALDCQPFKGFGIHFT